MDSQTAKVFRIIEAQTPEHLRHVTKDIDNELEEERIRQMIIDGRVTGKQKYELQRMLSEGAFKRKETVENQEVINELHRYQSAMIRKYRANGMLPEPKPDAWMQKRLAKYAQLTKKP